MVIIVAFWVLCGILGYLIGQAKGRGEEGAVAGLLLGPLGIIFMLVAGDKRPRCPACRQSVDPSAWICPHCQHQITEPPNVVCTFCRKGFHVTEATLGHAVRCPHCKKLTQARKPDLPGPRTAAGAR
jgi:phage FluMu protein Com